MGFALYEFLSRNSLETQIKERWLKEIEYVLIQGLSLIHLHSF